jgi:uncharacterized membrane protein
MTALALILCAAIAASGVVVIAAPARAHELTRLFADKTGLWVAAGIRAVLGLGLLAAAGESKAPMVLRVLGLIILLLGVATPLLGLDRHRRMIDWWLARDQSIQIICGGSAFLFGVALIYLIL